MRSFSMLKQVVHIVTTGLQSFNFTLYSHVEFLTCALMYSGLILFGNNYIMSECESARIKHRSESKIKIRLKCKMNIIIKKYSCELQFCWSQWLCNNISYRISHVSEK
jgi:hypothetical protein